jgi:hypothetical protein
MAPSTLRSALSYYLKRPGLTEDDRAHIKRWFVEADDPVWEKIAADTRAYGEVGPVVEGPYSIFIGSALRARCNAESLKDTSPSLLSKQEHQREQQRRIDLLELATGWMRWFDVIHCGGHHRPRRRPERQILVGLKNNGH